MSWIYPAIPFFLTENYNDLLFLTKQNDHVILNVPNFKVLSEKLKYIRSYEKIETHQKPGMCGWVD